MTSAKVLGKGTMSHPKVSSLLLQGPSRCQRRDTIEPVSLGPVGEDMLFAEFCNFISEPFLVRLCMKNCAGLCGRIEVT